MPFTKGHPTYKGIEKGQFKKGVVPFNKGTKGVMKPNKTSFKKGRKAPPNAFKKGQVAPMKGKKRPDMIGSLNRNWNNGKSFEPYTTDWNKTLKRSIRERDHYTCRECGALQEDRAFCIHHIDYDKKNCNPNNLITLCLHCHSKTNSNREYWEQHFKNMMEDIIN